MMVDKRKHILFYVIFAFLFLPLLQQNFSFITSGRLYGWFTTSPDVDFAWDKWFDGSYCRDKTKYYNDNVGFRPDLIRLGSQLDYSLFTKFRSNKIILGTDTSLLTPEFLDPFIGKDYAGYSVISENVRKLKAIQDTLTHLGKTMVLVYSPDKAYYYEDEIPATYKALRKGPDNYQVYIKVADSHGINQVDFNAWFMQLKHISTEVLYPKQGYHWSMYGCLLAADSLERYIEKARNIHMPHPVWDRVEHTSKPRYSDNDLALTLNLIYPTTKETFSYPNVTYPASSTMTKPKIIYLGDSFLFQWEMAGVMDNTNTGWQIWYYFNELYQTGDLAREAHHPTAETDWIKALENTDCLVIMYTPHNMYEIGDGFIDKAYTHFYPGMLK